MALPMAVYDGASMPETAMRRIHLALLIAQLGLLMGCYPRADLTRPLPSERHDAPRQPAHRLVVVLPGRGDDMDDLRRSGIVDAVQSAWPDADVLLTGLALNVYLEGQPAERLHRDILQPALQARPYRETWLLGASLGGMGALMVDRAYPGTVTGMVLLAPYLGEADILDEITAAGGLAAWSPGPVPAVIDRDNFQREAWRHLQGWQPDASPARHVWVGHGDRDYLKAAIPLLTPSLPAGHVLEAPGGHSWQVWKPLVREILPKAGPATLP